jgi:type VI secretion system protein ImpM
MSGPLLTAPGFWGKLPAAGDFVGRRLSAAFVQPWDRWVSRHLAPRLAAGDLLCFRLAVPPAPVTGVVLASADRAGRRFPLTLAAPLDGIAPAAWYAALTDLARAAAAGALDAAELDARLAGLPAPGASAEATGDELLLWTPGRLPRAVDPDAPAPVLDALVGAAAEAG